MRHTLVLSLVLLAAADFACAQWIRLGSKDFELYTNSSEEEARRTLDTFEQAREFFLRTKSFLGTPGMPVVLVAFRSARDYKPYSPREIVVAYHTSDEQRDYIVMSEVGEERTRVAIHEYVHVLVKHSGLKIPLWLNEGLAEVYGGMKARDGRVLVGNIPNDRAYSLGSGNWMPLRVLTNVRIDSPEYNEKTHAGLFYGQSCLLVHMLMLGDEYASKFPAFVERVAASRPAEEVFAELYGKSLASVERDMIAYFRQSQIGGAVFSVPAQSTVAPTVRETAEFEISAMLARVLAATGRFEEAAKRLDELAAARPGNGDVEEARAYLEWRRGDRLSAVRSFERACEDAGRTWKTHWDYARLLQLTGGNRGRRLDALRRTLELRPDFTAARLMLGRELYSGGRRAEALAEFRRISDIDPRQASGMYLMMAEAAAESDDRDEARKFAIEAKKHARSEDESTSADTLLRNLEGGPSGGGDDQRPVLRRRSPETPARQKR